MRSSAERGSLDTRRSPPLLRAWRRGPPAKDDGCDLAADVEQRPAGTSPRRITSSSDRTAAVGACGETPLVNKAKTPCISTNASSAVGHGSGTGELESLPAARVPPSSPVRSATARTTFARRTWRAWRASGQITARKGAHEVRLNQGVSSPSRPPSVSLLISALDPGLLTSTEG